MSIVWESQNRLFRNAVLTTQVIGFLLQTWKIVQDCVAYIGKGNPVFTEKRIKISRISRQTDYNKVCLL